MGKKGGIDGGFIIEAKQYLKEQNTKNKIEVFSAKKIDYIIINNKVYLYNGVNIEIGEACMNLITGRSGIG